MADDLILQADGICGGTTWWNNYPGGGARSCLFSGGGGVSSTLLPSYCSVGGGGDVGGGYGWLLSSNSTDDLGIKGKLMAPSNFYDDQQQQLESGSNFYDDIKAQENYHKTAYGQIAHHPIDGVVGGGGGLMDGSTTTLHEMIGFELSPSSSTSVDWNQQSLFSSGATADESYNSIILQENQANITRLNNYDNSNFIQKEWASLDSPPSTDQQQQQQQQAMNSGNCSTSSGDSSTVTYEAAAAAAAAGNQPPLVPTTATTPTFPMNSYSSPSSSSPLIQNMLADQVLVDLQPQVSLFNNDYSSAGIMNNNNNNTYVGSFQTNGLVNGGSGQNLLSTSTAAALEDIRATLLGTTAHNYIPHHHQPPSSNPNLASKVRKEGHESRNSVSAGGSSKARNNNEQPAFKRPRIDTPSPLPTFKVRKEKLGDRITALQQLVSPFGKTDTASVLQEAIEYIKFLHDQVHGLTTPYLKINGVAQHPHPQQHQTVNSNKQGAKEKEVGSSKQDLRSRGLCLVPLSTTFPVASETPVDFWTPTFGATFR